MFSFCDEIEILDLNIIDGDYKTIQTVRHLQKEKINSPQITIVFFLGGKTSSGRANQFPPNKHFFWGGGGGGGKRFFWEEFDLELGNFFSGGRHFGESFWDPTAWPIALIWPALLGHEFLIFADLWHFEFKFGLIKRVLPKWRFRAKFGILLSEKFLLALLKITSYYLQTNL